MRVRPWPRTSSASSTQLQRRHAWGYVRLIVDPTAFSTSLTTQDQRKRGKGMRHTCAQELTSLWKIQLRNMFIISTDVSPDERVPSALQSISIPRSFVTPRSWESEEHGLLDSFTPAIFRPQSIGRDLNVHPPRVVV